jgi:hypothetical protein
LAEFGSRVSLGSLHSPNFNFDWIKTAAIIFNLCFPIIFKLIFDWLETAVMVFDLCYLLLSYIMLIGLKRQQ